MARLGAVKPVKFFQKSNKIGAAFSAGGGDGQLAAYPIKRAHHGNLFGLPRNTQIGSTLGPGPRQIGMRQRFAFIGVKQHDIASFGLAPAELQPQANAIDRVCVLPSFQRVPRPAPAEAPFWLRTLESCDRPILMPSRFSISAMRRGIVQLGRLATGASSSGRDDAKRSLSFKRQRPRRDARLQGLNTAAHENAAPKPDRILAHAERLGNPRAGPAIERQQRPPRPVRLTAFPRCRQTFKRRPLFIARLHRRFPPPCPAPLRINAKRKS